jgi:hypothetical protein
MSKLVAGTVQIGISPSPTVELTSTANGIHADGQPVVVGTGIARIIALTQAQYDAISTPDITTLYVVVD